MKRIVFDDRAAKRTMRDLPAPRADQGRLLVRTTVSLVASTPQGEAGAVGVVEEVGKGLERAFRVGDRVAIAGDETSLHGEFNIVPMDLAVKIPRTISDQQASFCALGSLTLHGLRHLRASLGDVVAVVGLGVLGQLAVQLLQLSGVRVVALDDDPRRLKTARQFGAEDTASLRETTAGKAVRSLTDGRGVDGLVITWAGQAGLDIAAQLTAPRARMVILDSSGGAFPFEAFMDKELEITVSRGLGRDPNDHQRVPRWFVRENMAEILRLLSPRNEHPLEVQPLISQVYGFTEGLRAFDDTKNSQKQAMGLILTYPEPAEKKKKRTVPKTKAPAVPVGAKADVAVAVIGAGDFATNHLIPELKSNKGVHLHTLITQTSESAEAARRRFKFQNASTTLQDALGNREINAVAIATRNSSHAELVQKALRARKPVWVAKPLGLSEDDLDAITKTRGRSKAFFMTGYARRFSPLALEAREVLKDITVPKVVSIRINRGQGDPWAWVNASEEGGGRLIGDVCQFVDFARYLVGAPVQAVLADRAGVESDYADDAIITLRFVDGSLATITFTAQGDPAAGEERIEVFAGGTALAITDFERLDITRDGKTSKSSERNGLKKGFEHALEEFFHAVKDGGPAPIDEDEQLETALATLLILESLQTGRRVNL